MAVQRVARAGFLESTTNIFPCIFFSRVLLWFLGTLSLTVVNGNAWVFTGSGHDVAIDDAFA
jgi:hypothetical protein